jgi:hypothetical protein
MNIQRLLQEMGFDSARAGAVLTQCGGNLNEAIGVLATD